MTRTAEKQRPDVQRPVKELQSMTSSAECPGVPGIQHLLIYQHILTLTMGRTVTVFLKTIKNGSETLNYTYDANGNIISIKDSAGESTFRYDELNQLIRENNHQLNKTITYAYDLGGNLTVEKEYAL